jgi:hypothetical protein
MSIFNYQQHLRTFSVCSNGVDAGVLTNSFNVNALYVYRLIEWERVI